eukprot:tig00020510_g9886.t1
MRRVALSQVDLGFFNDAKSTLENALEQHKKVIKVEDKVFAAINGDLAFVYETLGETEKSKDKYEVEAIIEELPKSSKPALERMQEMFEEVCGEEVQVKLKFLEL